MYFTPPILGHSEVGDSEEDSSKMEYHEIAFTYDSEEMENFKCPEKFDMTEICGTL